MLGIDVKRGVASTLERVFNSSGERFNKLEVLWSGKTAGIIFDRNPYGCNAKVLFPNIDETSFIPNDKFNNLIGYALHELGHAWFTNNAPWDNARNRYGSYVSNLINGLEDPRIEKLVIESGRAPNSRALFENLINSVLSKDGYVDADDKRNIPFLLAVEGRRLNGYHINVPNIISKSPWKTHIQWALKRAHTARDTSAIVKIAIELFKRIREQEQGQGKPQQSEDGQQPSNGSQPSDGQTQDGQESQEGDNQGGGQPSDGDGQPSDDDGQDGKPEGDGQGESDEGKPDDGQQGGQSDEQSEQCNDSAQGSGKADESFDGGRDVEPSSFIERELQTHASSVDDGRPRPSVGKPVYETFRWS